jgi:cytochrome c oxidase assembly protein subunit 15
MQAADTASSVSSLSPGVALLAGITAVAGALGVFAVLAGRVRPQTLALGFAGTAVQWAIAYVAMTGVGLLAGEALFLLTALVPCAVGFACARWARAESSPSAAGLVNGVVNLLIVGSVVGGKDAKAAIVEAVLWSAGLLVGSGLLAVIGAAIARRSPQRQGVLPPPVSLFATVTAATIFLLLVTGGLVTGLEAGLAVPDWPNSFGHNMLLYPVSQMKGGIYYEHAHRLFGMLVGLAAFTLAAICWRHEPRRWVRGLATAVLAMVCVQGLMGGLRVTGTLTISQDASILRPSTLLAIAHGVFGQLVFASVALIAAVTSARWTAATAPLSAPAAGGTRVAALVAPIALFMQLFLGAAYRHLQVPPTEAGKAIVHPTWAMHGHLGFAVVALIAVLIAASRMSGAGRAADTCRPLGRVGSLMALVVALQVALGFLAWGTVMMRRGPAIPLWEVLSTSAHQATGAMLLMLAVLGAAWARRLLAAEPARELSSTVASA